MSGPQGGRCRGLAPQGRRHGARTFGVRPPSILSQRVWLVGLALCAKHALEGVDVKVRLGQQALDLAVVQLEQPFGLRGVHAAVLRALFVKRRITKTVFAPDLLDRDARLGLPQKTNDLLFAVFTWFACPSFSRLMDFLEK